VAATAHSHAFAQRDLGGHPERDLDFGAFLKRRVGKKKDSTRTQVLRETDSFNGARRLVKRKWEKVGKPLSDTAFNPNWRSGHGGVTSLPNRRGSAGATLAHGERQVKS
jgi:hypothetical protein